MDGYKLVKINAFSLKIMSEYGLRAEDWRYLDAYGRFLDMRRGGEKYDYAVARMAAELGISVSGAKRVIRRFSRAVAL